MMAIVYESDVSSTALVLCTSSTFHESKRSASSTFPPFTMVHSLVFAGIQSPALNDPPKHTWVPLLQILVNLVGALAGVVQLLDPL